MVGELKVFLPFRNAALDGIRSPWSWTFDGRGACAHQPALQQCMRRRAFSQ